MANLKNVEIVTGTVAGEAKIVIDGDDITDSINEFSLTLKAGGIPKLTVTYLCDQLSIKAAQADLKLEKGRGK